MVGGPVLVAGGEWETVAWGTYKYGCNKIRGREISKLCDLRVVTILVHLQKKE